MNAKNAGLFDFFGVYPRFPHPVFKSIMSKIPATDCADFAGLQQNNLRNLCNLRIKNSEKFT